MGLMAWSQDADLAAYCHSITVLLILTRHPRSFLLFARFLEVFLGRNVLLFLAMLSGRHPPPSAMKRLY
jgi:hypothetical protein